MIKDRLIAFLEYLDIGQNKFAQNVGLSAGFVNNLGKNIRSKSLNKILSTYPQLNENWLLTGEGEMIKPNTQNINIEGGNNKGLNNINGSSNIAISQNDISEIIEIQKEMNGIIKTIQSQLSESQKQVSDLIEILKNK